MTPAGRSRFGLAILAGALLRVAALMLPATSDVPLFKVWTYNATTLGVTEVYGVGGAFPYRRPLEFGGVEAKVDYPPLALYELAAVGALYSWANGGRFPDSQALTIAIKMPAVVCDIGMLLLIFAAIRHFTRDTAAARTWALAVWLNPAIILIGSVLGYLDPLFVLPVTGALLAAAAGRPGVAGALLAAACLTKPQAILVAPAVALAVWNTGDTQSAWRRIGAASAGAAMVAIVIVGPIAARGAFLNLIWGLGSLSRHRFLSGNAANLWWLVDYLLQVSGSIGSRGLWGAVTRTGIEPTLQVASPDVLRLIGVMLTAFAVVWAMKQARRADDLWLLAALGAFLIHAYVTLAVSVHENHLIGAVPLLALASAGRPRFIPIFVALSAIVTLNLNLFAGLGDVGYAIPRGVTIVDATVVLALLNCAAFAWHAAVFKSECCTFRGRGRAAPDASGRLVTAVG